MKPWKLILGSTLFPYPFFSRVTNKSYPHSRIINHTNRCKLIVFKCAMWRCEFLTSTCALHRVIIRTACEASLSLRDCEVEMWGSTSKVASPCVPWILIKGSLPLCGLWAKRVHQTTNLSLSCALFWTVHSNILSRFRFRKWNSITKRLIIPDYVQWTLDLLH